MARTILYRAILAFSISTFSATALGNSLEQRATCTRSTTAESGDTCASIAAREGVTVAEIIKYNPSITSCSELTVGGTYCLAMSDSTSSATGPSAPAASLKPSVDGDCGNGITCIGSKYGDCCSAHGYCGKLDSYCGAGCQSAFGLCQSTQPAPPPTSDAPGGAATSTIFQTVLTTVTITSTTQLIQPTTSVVLATSVKTSTRLITQTTTSILVLTNTITTIKTISSFAGCGPAATATPGVPVPTLPNTPSSCKKYYQTQEGDTCAGIANDYQITLANFYRLNPSVGPAIGTLLCASPIIDMVISGLCKVNCDNLWAGYYVCVGT